MTHSAEQLPAGFLRRMEKILGAEYPDFLASYGKPRTQGLRVNTLKITVEDFRAIAPFRLRQIPWLKEGFHYDEQDEPGKHPYHAAGLYYIQEPSAMAVAAALAPEPGERVLDLCAAPGGKATHLAALMGQEGLLMANEIHPARVKALAENLERCGVRNAVVTCAHPAQLAERFPAFFDRVLADAPCSGEGMFRKDITACNEWNEDNVKACARRQSEVLEAAAKMVRPGGKLVYSTCTFAPEENEGVVAEFLRQQPGFELEKIPDLPGLMPGRPEWAGSPGEDSVITRCRRLWPHIVDGEGHFMALFRRRGEDTAASPGKAAAEREPDRKLLQLYQKFAGENLRGIPEGRLILFGDHLYLTPAGLPGLQGLKVIRPGWHLGTFMKNRFEPSHALAQGITAADAARVAGFAADSDALRAYLRGETCSVAGEDGWTLVTVDRYPLGWGKVVAGILKNHYPKGLRWLR